MYPLTLVMTSDRNIAFAAWRCIFLETHLALAITRFSYVRVATPASGLAEDPFTRRDSA